MITPKFSCSQNEKSVITKCYMPAIRASEVDIDVDGPILTLHVNPYFLRLTFPHRLVEDDDSSASYDPSSGFLTVTLTKEVEGQEFEDLDMLARLLAPSTSTSSSGPRTVSSVPLLGASAVSGTSNSMDRASSQLDALTLAESAEPGDHDPEATRRDQLPARPLIEVISTSEDVEDSDDEDTLASPPAPSLIDDTAFAPSEEMLAERATFLEAAANDWRIPQTLPTDPDPDYSTPNVSLTTEVRYGFLDAYSGYFRSAGSSPNEVNELGDQAESARPVLRTEVRIASEEKKWDEDYYLADLMNDEEIQELIRWESPFAPSSSSCEFAFTQEENDAMLRLPRKEYLPTSTEIQKLLLTLLSILFSYAYDSRTTQHDPTSESAWTLSILTPCFSALDVSPSSSLSSTFTASYRRALAFPLYRNWQLCERVRADVSDILEQGKRGVVRALLEVRGFLERSDVYYVYNKIWVEDFCVWVQTSGVTDEMIASLCESVRGLRMRKDMLGWGLNELEQSALGAQEDSDSDDDSDDDSD